jgi:sugar lactone lactonase YvrE
MRAIIDRRLALQERSGTVLVRGAEIWTYGATTRKFLYYPGIPDHDVVPSAPLPSIPIEDAALTWDGNHLLVADRLQRKVFRVDPVSGQETLVMDPDTLAFGEHDTALRVVDTLIGDIAWYGGIVYIAVQAGYSSAIYGIDLEAKQVVSYRRAPGPKPWGLDFDPGDGSLYTVDNRNRELRRFSNDGEVDVAELPSEWVEPRGLSFDQDHGLWSADWSTGDMLRLRVEG